MLVNYSRFKLGQINLNYIFRIIFTGIIFFCSPKVYVSAQEPESDNQSQQEQQKHALQQFELKLSCSLQNLTTTIQEEDLLNKTKEKAFVYFRYNRLPAKLNDQERIILKEVELLLASKEKISFSTQRMMPSSQELISQLQHKTFVDEIIRDNVTGIAYVAGTIAYSGPEAQLSVHDLEKQTIEIYKNCTFD